MASQQTRRTSSSSIEALGGQQAVEHGLKVAWFTFEEGVLLSHHRADDTVSKAIARVLRADLVVVYDIGLLPVAQDAAEGPPDSSTPPMKNAASLCPPTCTPPKRTCSRELVQGGAQSSRVRGAQRQPEFLDVVGEVGHHALRVHAERDGDQFGVHGVTRSARRVQRTIRGRIPLGSSR